MKKTELAHILVRENYEAMPMYHYYKKHGYDSATARHKTETYYAKNYTKQELQDMYDEN